MIRVLYDTVFNKFISEPSMKIPHTISLGFFLFVLWLLLSGHYNNFLISLGIASVIFILWIVKRMDVVDHESHPNHLNPFSFISYWCWLMKEIVVSNIDVCKCIFSPGLPIQPQVITLTATQQSDLGRVIYANSITLTPGTITLNINQSQLQVHALMEKNVVGLQTGEMDSKVSNLESGT